MAELIEMQRRAYDLRTQNLTLEEIQNELYDIFGERRSTTQISKWIGKVAKSKVEDEELLDLKVQRARGISELEHLEKITMSAIKDKKIEYTYIDKKGTEITEDKILSPMVYNMFLTTMINIIDKKNQLRGLTNTQAQIALFQQYNSINKNDDVTSEYKNFDPKIQQQLKEILGESTEMDQVSEEPRGSRVEIPVKSRDLLRQEDQE